MLGTDKIQTADFWNADTRALSLAEVEYLYAQTDWRFIWADKSLLAEIRSSDLIITEIPALVKAFSLQYLLNIPAENSLARALSKNPALRTLCQLPTDKHLTAQAVRSKLQRFKQNHFDLYVTLLLRSLISLVLGGREANISVPFAYQVEAANVLPAVEYDDFELTRFGPKVHMWTTPKPGEESNYQEVELQARGKTIDQLYKMLHDTGIPSKDKTSLRNRYEQRIPFPVEVHVEYPDGTTIQFSIERTYWLTEDNSGQTFIGSKAKASRQYEYTACYAIISNKEGKILLSQRKSDYHGNYYTLPGGKRDKSESLMQCVIREVSEETGIRILQCKPVSIYSWRMPGRPPVHVVGVVVTQFQGEVRNIEAKEHTSWEWYDFCGKNIANLPTPLFFPTKAILQHYSHQTYPDLEWENLEMQSGLSLNSPPQFQQATLF